MSASPISATLVLLVTPFLAGMNNAQAEAFRLVGKPLTDAIAMVESGNRNDAVGDNGKALGALQIHPGVVEDVNRHFGLGYYHSDALDRGKAELIFWRYMMIYATPQRLKRSPTEEDIALIWHLGPGGFAGRETTHRLRAEAYLSKLRPLLNQP